MVGVRCYQGVVMALCLTLASGASAGDACWGPFADLGTQKDRRQRLVEALDEWVAKHGTLPSEREFAKFVDGTQADLKTFWATRNRPHSLQDLARLAIEEMQRGTVAKLRSQAIKTASAHILENFDLVDLPTLAYELKVDSGVLEAIFDGSQDLWQQILRESPEVGERLEKSLLSSYAKLSKEYGRTLTLSEFAEVHRFDSEHVWLFSGDKALFENFEALKEESKKLHENDFEEVIDAEFFSDARKELLMQALKKHKRFVVTTAVSGAEVEISFLASLRSYCEENDAALLVIPANMMTNQLDPRLLEEDWIHILANEVELSKFLRIANIRVDARQINPLRGLDTVGPRNQAAIVGSPKMFAKVVHTTDNQNSPHLLISTGAVTKANYGGKKYAEKRKDRIAQDQHRLGAVVLEKQNSQAIRLNPERNLFHVRHIEYLVKEQGFTDIDHFYSGNRTPKETRPAAMVLGDLHVGALDRDAFDQVKREIARLRPEKIIIHDLFDGRAVNHHEKGKSISRAKTAQQGGLDLAAELAECVDLLNEILSLDPSLEIVIVRSNHDQWLDRWVEDGGYLRDPHNQAIGLLIAAGMSAYGHEQALAYAVQHLGTDPKNQDIFDRVLFDPERVSFLADGEVLRVGPDHRLVTVSYHGHVGANGSRGASLKTMANANDRSVIAHTHTIGRENDAVNVGTLTLLELSYNKEGSSNWVQSIALVGANGDIQVLTLDNGTFRAGPGATNPRDFFPLTFPIIVPNNIAF